MGVDLLATAEVARNRGWAGRLGRPASPAKMPRRLARKIEAALAGDALEPFCRSSFGEASAQLFLHPAASPVELRVDGNTLVLEARTSSAGPGYHAWLVDTFESVSSSLDLVWDWSHGDEGGYAQNGDFEELQQHHLGWLRALSNAVLENDELRGINICMPMDFLLAGDHVAAAPRGFLDRNFFADVMAEGDRAVAAAARFFAWWDRPQDQAFIDGLVDVLLWSELRWRPPQDVAEERLMRAAADALRLSSDPDCYEGVELLQLIASAPEDATPPAPELRGFARGLMTRLLPGGWRVDVPGYYYEEPTEDAASVFWFQDRTVRVTTYNVSGVAGAEIADRVGEFGGEEELAEEEGHLVRRAALSQDEDQLLLQGVVATDGQMAVTTLTFADPADRDWALGTWRSIFRPPDEGEG